MRVLVPRGGCPPGGWKAGKRIGLDEHEIHHLKVRRAKEGERVEILDGAGLQGTGTLLKANREWMVEVNAAEVHEPPAALTLGVAAGDRDRFSWMVEKLVELGVTRIVPLETARTSGVATRLKASHIARTRRSALEAIKQCGASWAAVIEEPIPWSRFVSEPLSGTGWLAHQTGVPAPASMDRHPATVLIGPEGGLTEDEMEMAVSAGYRATALGEHTLRFETAALAAASVIAQARLRGHHG